MNPLKFISNLFKHNTSTNDLLHNNEEAKKKNWEAKYNDLGIFNYNDLGFNIKLDNELYLIKWTDIERLQAYKVDLMTTDEICMDITFNNRWIMITEETAGWYQFIERIKSALPEINNKWEASVLKSPFEYDLTTIYERVDRKMPEKSNFFSTIKGKNEEEVSEIFKSNGWTIRNSSTKNFKLENSWTDLILESDGENLLLHGLVAIHPDNIKIIKLIYNSLQCAYKFEFYDSDKLIEQTKNGM
jgi:hypothetical protein